MLLELGELEVDRLDDERATMLLVDVELGVLLVLRSLANSPDERDVVLDELKANDDDELLKARDDDELLNASEEDELKPREDEELLKARDEDELLNASDEDELNPREDDDELNASDDDELLKASDDELLKASDDNDSSMAVALNTRLGCIAMSEWGLGLVFW